MTPFTPEERAIAVAAVMGTIGGIAKGVLGKEFGARYLLGRALMGLVTALSVVGLAFYTMGNIGAFGAAALAGPAGALQDEVIRVARNRFLKRASEKKEDVS